MLIRNLKYDKDKHIKVTKKKANLLRKEGFIEIGIIGKRYVFLRSEELDNEVIKIDERVVL